MMQMLSLLLKFYVTLVHIELAFSQDTEFDSSIDSYINVRYCAPGETCKSPYEDAFACKCLPQYICSAHSWAEDALCQISDIGYVWLQPALIPGRFKLENEVAFLERELTEPSLNETNIMGED